ncbi:hypothetical protein GGR52DRAFT_583659 [Hypoxylon sp. FL1284]|nr:hypothetical protein GGR52DRAFT_583659 [Hypoxylon sp. FL1284]
MATGNTHPMSILWSSQRSNHVNVMRWYFDKAGDKKFRWGGLHRQGSSSLCLRFQALVKSIDGLDVWKDFIIKTPFWGRADLLEDEIQRLDFIKGPHIVQKFDLPDHPFKQNLTASKDTHFPGVFVVLEYMENGSLSDVICRTKVAGIPHLSNRLLWLVFRCLLAICIDMEYPSAVDWTKSDGPRTIDGVWDEAPSGFFHPDLKPEHILVGRCAADSAYHKVCPVLKAASLGRRSLGQDIYGPHGARDNLKSIAMIMICLIVLEDRDNLAVKEILFDAPDGIIRETQAGQICPTPNDEETMEYLWLDWKLRELLVFCTATYEGDRPDLRSAWNRVQEVIAHQEASGVGESDGQVRRFFEVMGHRV